MSYFSSVADVERRVNEPITAAADIETVEALLEIVSEDIRAYGSPWPEPLLAPRLCHTTAMKAAARGWLNLAGYTMERSDMLTLQRSDAYADGEALTRAEIKAIERIAGVGAFYSVPVLRPVFPVFGVGEDDQALASG